MTTSDKDCSFYNRTGSCVYGDGCIHHHPKTTESHIVIIPRAYVPPLCPSISEIDWFEDFVEDILDEAEKIGPVDDLIVVDNAGEHLIGNTYIQFRSKSDAKKCVELWSGRFYRARALSPKLAYISHFNEARCYQNDLENCKRNLTCNFLHVRPLPHWLLLRLYDETFFKTIHTETLQGLYAPELYAEQFKRRGFPVPTLDDQIAQSNTTSATPTDSKTIVSSSTPTLPINCEEKDNKDGVIRRGRGFDLKS